MGGDFRNSGKKGDETMRLGQFFIGIRRFMAKLKFKWAIPRVEIEQSPAHNCRVSLKYCRTKGLRYLH